MRIAELSLFYDTTIWSGIAVRLIGFLFLFLLFYLATTVCLGFTCQFTSESSLFCCLFDYW